MTDPWDTPMSDGEWCEPDQHCSHLEPTAASSGWSYICCQCGWDEDADG